MDDDAQLLLLVIDYGFTWMTMVDLHWAWLTIVEYHDMNFKIVTL